MPPTMQRINMNGYGGVEALFTETVPAPRPQAGEILIQTAYAGVNRPDIMQRQGHYPMPAGVTPIMGLELSGTIAALGARVTVLEACAPAQALPLPAGYSLQEAAMLPETLFTV